MNIILLLVYFSLVAKSYCSSHNPMSLETAILILAAVDESWFSSID